MTIETLAITIDDEEPCSKCTSFVVGPMGIIGELNIAFDRIRQSLSENRWSYLAACWESCSSFFRCSNSTVCNISLIVVIYALNYTQHVNEE